MMRRLAAIVGFTAAMLATQHARAGSYTFNDITNPSTSDNIGVVTGVNDSGTIAGYTYSNGISGYLRDAGGTFTYPAPSSLSSPIVYGISNNGYATLLDRSAPGASVIQKPDGSFSDPITSLGGSSEFQFSGINSSGVAVGFWSNGFQKSGLIYDSTTGHTTVAKYLGTNQTWFSGINDSGTVVGYEQDTTSPFNQHGLIRSAAGVYTTFDIAGATKVEAFGINDNGVIVGAEFSSVDHTFHGFIRGTDGSITIVDNPEAVKGTFLTGINDAGELTGYWVNSNFQQIGFTAMPITTTAVPEPSSMTLLAIGSIAAFCVARRRLKSIA